MGRALRPNGNILIQPRGCVLIYMGLRWGASRLFSSRRKGWIFYGLHRAGLPAWIYRKGCRNRSQKGKSSLLQQLEKLKSGLNRRVSWRTVFSDIFDGKFDILTMSFSRKMQMQDSRYVVKRIRREKKSLVKIILVGLGDQSIIRGTDCIIYREQLSKMYKETPEGRQGKK